MPRLSDRLLRWLAWLLVGVYFVLSGMGILLLLLANPSSELYGFPMVLWILVLVLVGIWPVIGALIINRHPRHPVGWLLFATFPLLAVFFFAIGYVTYATSPVSGPLPIPAVIGIWLTGIAQPFVRVAFTWMNLLFPTGRLFSPRWRIVGWAAIAALPVFTVLLILLPGPLNLFPELDNPFGAAEPLWTVLEPLFWLSDFTLYLCSLASCLSLFLRFRQSRGDERQQIKWLVLPAFVFWLSQPKPFMEYTPRGILEFFEVSLAFISVPLIVTAVAVAIFKYRLYDIDVIIRRTLVYSALTLILVLAYFSSVVLLQGLFVTVTGQESAVAIVVSTLLIAALFTPLRRRLQGAIDRRFYRRRYDATQTLEAFAAGLRQEVDLEQVSRRLLAVTAESMQPEHASLWLKPERGEPTSATRKGNS